MTSCASLCSVAKDGDLDVRATQDNLAIQPLRRADRALLTAPQLTGAGAQRRGARPRGASRARPDLHLALFRGASNQSRIYSVMALSNQSGQLAERYGYTPYGKRRVVSPGGATLAASAVGNQVGFTGRYHDAETGLTYFRARYMDAELGRFVSRDPIEMGDWSLSGGQADTLSLNGSVPLSTQKRVRRSTGARGGRGVLFAAVFVPNQTDPLGLFKIPNVSACEVAAGLCLIYPSDLKKVADFEKQAKAMAEATKLPGRQDGPQDAYRHCVWSCIMAKFIDEHVATVAGNIHEVCVENTASAHRQDFNNNKIGRNIGLHDGDCDEGCTGAMDNGTLWVNATDPGPRTPSFLGDTNLEPAYD